MKREKLVARDTGETLPAGFQVEQRPSRYLRKHGFEFEDDDAGRWIAAIEALAAETPPQHRIARPRKHQA